MQPAEAEQHYGEALRAFMAQTGRPLSPAFTQVFDGWVDPTARPQQPAGSPTPLTAEERTWMSVLAFYGAEGAIAILTPYGLALMAQAALWGIAISDEEIAHGYHGLDVDPWHELRHLPAAAREQFQRALWHIAEGLKLAGFEEPDDPQGG